MSDVCMDNWEGSVQYKRMASRYCIITTLEGFEEARWVPISLWAMAGLHFHPKGREGMEYTLPPTPIRTLCICAGGTLHDQKQFERSNLQK